MNCDFASGAKGETCSTCGYVLRAAFAEPPLRTCSGAIARCPHLGDRFDDVLAPCRTCGGKDKLAPVIACACDLYGRCLPVYRPVAGVRERWEATAEARSYRLCAECPENPANG